MKVELRFIKESHFDEFENEEKERRKISYCVGRSYSDVIGDVHNEIERVVRSRFQMGEDILDEYYPHDRKELKKSNTPVLEYKAMYTNLGGEATVWEVYYYMEIEAAPDVVATLEF